MSKEGGPRRNSLPQLIFQKEKKENIMTTQPNVPVAPMVEEEVVAEAITVEQELSGLTAKELKERVQRINERFGLTPQDPGYLKTSGKKNELIEAVIEQEVLNSVHDAPVASAQGKVVEVKLSQVRVNPRNYRHDIDYEDRQLMHDIRVAGGLLKAPIVRRAGADGNGQDVYEIVGGNRSTTALRKVLAEQGLNPEDYTLHVIVRDYEGSQKQQVIQEILEMLSDNESAQPMSPRDRLHAYKDLERAGLDRASIAKKQGVTPAYITQTLKLEFLPEKVLDLVHFDFNKDRIALQGVEKLKEHGIPFEESPDGSVNIMGVSLSNANTMTTLFPRRPARSVPNFEIAFQEWEQKVMDVQDFLIRQDVLTAAKTRSGGDFKSFLRRKAEEAGIVSKSTSSASPEAVEVEVESSEEEGQASRPSEKASKKTEKVTSPDVGISAYDAATRLVEGSIDFDMNWDRKFAEELKMGNAQAYSVFKFLYAAGILVEVEKH
jgi:hypothetical protein